MMTERELKLKELDNLEEELFVLQMKDHWSSDDYWEDRELRNKINQLRKEVGLKTKATNLEFFGGK